MPTSDLVCISCRRPRATLTCELCHEPLCKECLQFVEDTTFSFFTELPEELSHTDYCTACHTNVIEPALEKYNELMERAKNAYVFTTNQKKPVPMIKRSNDKIHVEECDDRDETFLRLAFKAVELGFNSVVQADVVGWKVRTSGYQRSKWKGVAFPANVDVGRLERAAARNED